MDGDSYNGGWRNNTKHSFEIVHEKNDFAEASKI